MTPRTISCSEVLRLPVVVLVIVMLDLLKDLCYFRDYILQNVTPILFGCQTVLQIVRSKLVPSNQTKRRNNQTERARRLPYA